VSSEKRRYELKARAEKQQQTRDRIVEATMDLHREVGPAATTVAEIARRAGVQRLTVYNHFPDDAELFGACQAHWLELHPPPDPSGALGLADPRARARSVLASFYAWYRETESMAGNVQRDRAALPALDELLRETADARAFALADALAAGFGPPSTGRSAMARLALDFWTWRRLASEGLDDEDAADLMAGAVAGAG
jgi:AcrR family transcriptional regulator